MAGRLCGARGGEPSEVWVVCAAVRGLPWRASMALGEGRSCVASEKASAAPTRVQGTFLRGQGPGTPEEEEAGGGQQGGVGTCSDPALTLRIPPSLSQSQSAPPLLWN